MNGSAEYYQAHKDDEDEWGEAEQGRKPSRRLASMISVRFSPEEAARVRLHAEAVGESLSTFIRRATMERASQPTDEERAQAGLEFVEAFEREFGPIPEEVQKEVHEKWVAYDQRLTSKTVATAYHQFPWESR